MCVHSMYEALTLSVRTYFLMPSCTIETSNENKNLSGFNSIEKYNMLKDCDIIVKITFSKFSQKS